MEITELPGNGQNASSKGKPAQKETCDLCGLPIEGKPIVHTFDGEEKYFCCQGCARVYQVAYDNNMLEQVKPQPQAKRPGFTDLVLDRGETSYFSLNGMWCAGCATAAEQVLRNQPGVKDIDISFAAERGRIQYDPEQVDVPSVLKELDHLGYHARILGDPGQREAERKQEHTLLQLIVAAAFGMQVMLLYIERLYPLYATGQFDSDEVQRLQYLIWLLATPILFVGGSSFLRGAWRSLRARTATMDTLVALGTLAAYSYSVYVTLTGSGEAYFDSVAMITTFIMLGRYLETLGGNQARKDIRKLLTLQPDTAWRKTDSGWQKIPASKLIRDDVILVKPGERVPTDAEIVEGEGALDETLLTGESTPVNKGPGHTIFAGTVLTDAALTGRVLQPLQETRLAQITRLVEETLSVKPPIQRLADRVSAYFAFGILAVAMLTAFGWGLMGYPSSQALLAAVAVLVVACPCALGLATPLALTVTLGRTTQAGILVRNPTALETAAQVNRIVFDKTGTLTQGRMTVVATRSSDTAGWSQDDLLCLAAGVEQYSEHPVAQAIVNACSRPLPPTSKFQALRGLGASARVAGHNGSRVMVGSARFLDVGQKNPLADEARPHAARGESIVWVGRDDEVAGFIALRDEPNPTAKQALQQLQREAIRLVVLSGDNPRTTETIARELGVSEYEGNCPPADKARRIEEWQAAGEHVAMIGDGVNDAPALAQANLSITVAGAQM